MPTINLTAANMEHKILKDHLENNASEALAEKINNGVRIEKDGKTLINKKNLNIFMKYAYEEAQKQAEKGARFACIDYKVIFGWLMHYFEEDSITGTLFNEDGTEYNPPKPIIKNTPAATAAVTPVKPKPQISLFDLIDIKPKSEAEEAEEFDDLDEPDEDEPEEEPEFRRISENKYIDKDGIIYNAAGVTKTATETAKPILPAEVNPVIPNALIKLFGSAITAR